MIKVQGITLEILREVEILSDEDGRYFFYLANIYAPKEMRARKQQQ